ncbi:hypothetical protein LZ023_39525 (plasmid) [Pseudomonas silvicola]|nr:hypothetical protein LZ023_39525 [Pseudomonas silvicola]
MRRYFIRSFLIIGLLGSSCLSLAEQTAGASQLAGLIREPLSLTITFPNGQRGAGCVCYTTRLIPGVCPIALITHGTDGSEQSDRQHLTPNRFSAAAITFARHGYAAVVVMRQGYGQSTRPQRLSRQQLRPAATCSSRKMARDDILAALTAIRVQPWAAKHPESGAGRPNHLADSACSPPVP